PATSPAVRGGRGGPHAGASAWDRLDQGDHSGSGRSAQNNLGVVLSWVSHCGVERIRERRQDPSGERPTMNERAGRLLLATAISSYLAIQANRAQTKARAAEATARTERDRALEAEANLLRAQDEETRAKQSESEARAVLAFFEEKILGAARPQDQEGG